MMQTKLTTKLFCLLLMLMISSIVLGQGKPKKPRPEENEEQSLLRSTKGIAPPSGARFYIGPIQGTEQFSILLTDGSRMVTGSFTAHQVDVMEAVLLAAKEFAMTDEKVGSNAPVTTRLMDERERAFFVDVAKIGNRSRFYVSLDTMNGKVITPAGEILRDSKKEPSGLLVTMLTQIQQAKSGVTIQ
jgi:hypothetical protein